jgi:hypothetical protein
MKQPKISPIFAVRLILPRHLSDFCKHLTDGHHIAQNRRRDRKIPISKSVRAWQNWTDSLANSVGRDKNRKRHCSCKWDLTEARHPTKKVNRA